MGRWKNKTWMALNWRFGVMAVVAVSAFCVAAAGATPRKAKNEPAAPQSVKRVPSKLPDSFDPEEFVKKFEVHGTDLPEDVHYTSTYALPYRWFEPKGLPAKKSLFEKVSNGL